MTASNMIDNAALQLADSSLPALALPWSSSSTSNSEVAVVDLLTPPPNPPVSPTQSARMESRTSTVYRSKDEKRLMGDYGTPADATAVPDPQSWMGRGEDAQGTMHKKPRSNGSFRPINTINDVNPGMGGRKHVTYGKKYRVSHSTISETRHSGQMAYLAREKANTLSPPNSKFSSPHKPSASPDESPPRKKGKTLHYIDLVSDNMGESCKEPSLPAKSTNFSKPQPASPSIRSPQSHYGMVSANVTTQDKHAVVPRSEFNMIDNVTNARQKRERRTGQDKNQPVRFGPKLGDDSSPGLSSLYEPSNLHKTPNVHFPSDNKTPRQQILGEINQGPTASSPIEHQQQLSSRFPNMRINESIAKPIVDLRCTAGDKAGLRKQNTFTSPASSIFEQDNSEDELAVSNSNTSQITQKRSKSPPKKTDRTWPLDFARTQSCSVERQKGSYNLTLQGNTNAWHVILLEAATGEHHTKFQIRCQDITNIRTDHSLRVRLKGPRSHNGTCVSYDLQFSEAHDLGDFLLVLQKHCVMPKGPQRDREDGMINLFKKPLSQTEKINTSNLPGHDLLEAGIHETHKSSPTQAAPPDGRVSPARHATSCTPSKQKNLSQPAISAIRTTSRAMRSTRSCVPNDNSEMPTGDKEVEKFSIIKGLGSPWYKPLEYGEGRQRAVVHFNDLPRLDEGECLNDSLIDFYMIYLFNKFKVSPDKVYFFNTYFFTQLTKNASRESVNYKAVEKWTSKVNVFGHDYLVIPINEATHWYLAIICNVSAIDQKVVIGKSDEHTSNAPESSNANLDHGALSSDKETNDQTQAASNVSVANYGVGHEREQQSDDPNLFDEESQLRLIDRDEGEEQGHCSLSSPPLIDTRNAKSISDGDVMSSSTLHRSIASSQSKSNKHSLPQSKKDPNQPIILILDSLGQTRSGTVRALKDWLTAEGKAKCGIEVNIKEKGYYPKSSHIPMQDNWTDCGIYLLGYVEKFFKDPDEFKTRLLTGDISAKDDWPELQPMEVRANMREILFTVAKDHKLVRMASKKASMKVWPRPAPVTSQAVISEAEK